MPANSYAAPTVNPNQTVPNKLFRFVDFSVEPGKTYQYRIQLWLLNPNFGLKPECLENAMTSGEKGDQVTFDRADAAGHRPTPVSNSGR